MDASSLPIANPWLDQADPTSQEQPHLVVNLRYFKNSIQHRRPGTSYTYRLPANSPHKIPFYEILGCGPPPTDVPGNPEDIYVDLMSFALHFRGNHIWECWNEPSAEVKEALLPQHPIFYDRYLACPTQGHYNVPYLSWYPARTIKRTWSFSVKDPIDPAEVIGQVYEGLYEVSADKKISVTSKGRKRRSSVGALSTTVPHRKLIMKIPSHPMLSCKKPKITTTSMAGEHINPSSPAASSGQSDEENSEGDSPPPPAIVSRPTTSMESNSVTSPRNSEPEVSTSPLMTIKEEPTDSDT